jgi:hypothetical protein
MSFRTMVEKAVGRVKNAQPAESEMSDAAERTRSAAQLARTYANSKDFGSRRTRRGMRRSR